MLRRCPLSLALALTVLTVLSVRAAGQDVGPVWRYPAADRIAAWEPLPAEAPATFSDAPTAAGPDAGSVLALSFVADGAVALRLREPLPLPEGVRDLTFLSTNSGQQMRVRVHVLVRDATGVEFTYNTRSDLKIKAAEGEFYPTSPEHRSVEARHHTQGFTFADIRRTIRPAAGNRLPQAPLTWTGLLVEVTGLPEKRGDATLYFHDFASSTLTPNASRLHYQFLDRESLGEVDGLPHITPGMFWWWPGTYRIAWDVRDSFAGQPILRGGTEIVATKDGAVPLAVQLAQHIEIPVAEPGTYWVRVRVRRTDVARNYRYYARCEEREYRLDVLDSDSPARQRVPTQNDAFTFIRIAPERASLVYEAAEPFTVPVTFYRPAAAATAATATPEAAFTARLAVRSYARGDDVRSLDLTPQWDADGRWTTTVDLGDQGPGGYVITATLIDGEAQDFDTTTRLVARRAATVAELAPIPDSVPSAQALLASDEPMFHLDSTYYTAEWLANPRDAWEKGHRPFLDEAGTVSKDIEFNIFWRLAEPVPGVFDWDDADRFLDYAQSKGLRVLLRLDFRGPAVPEWLPAQVVRTREGNAFGHTAYLFHGMQPNFFSAPELRAALTRYQQAAVAHFRGHPAVQSYYWVAEHPGDAPWNGFIAGYSAETLASFRAWLQAQYGSVAACNAALGTAFADWSAAEPATLDAPDRYRLAWLRFREASVDTACRAFVEATRRVDPRRLLMLYSTQHDPGWFVARGCMTANGGTHDAFMSSYLGMGLSGFQMRNEEITPRAWSGTGPYQLPATVFHAAYAGGAHTHCKAFIATWKRLAEVQGPPYSLAAYTDFQRIWRELRQTEPMPPETFVFLDDASFLLQVNAVGVSATPGGWPIVNSMSAHLQTALASHEHWQHARLLLACGQYVETLERATIEQLVAYVEGGGTLYMRADAGRTCLETPAEDWVLLRRFGFTPPAEPMDGRYMQATSADGKGFRIRDFWKTEAQGETLATIDGSTAPAISAKPFGKGQVIVRWAQTDVPAVNTGGYPILADIATRAGVTRHALGDSPFLWTYLLKHRSADRWYGFVYNGPKNARPNEDAVSGRTWWPTLPDGDYRVTELITQTDLGTHPASALRETGISLTLEPQQVAIYRLEKSEPNP